MELTVQVRYVYLVLLLFVSLQIANIAAEENSEDGQEHKEEKQIQEENKHIKHPDGSKQDPLKFAKDVG